VIVEARIADEGDRPLIPFLANANAHLRPQRVNFGESFPSYNRRKGEGAYTGRDAVFQ
jgi:hypothetical protein